MAWITELIHPKFGGTLIHKRIWNIYYLFYIQLNHCHLPTQHHWTLTKMSPNFRLMSVHYVAASHSAWINVVLGLTTNPVESIRGSKELSWHMIDAWYWLKDLPNLRHVQRIFCWKNTKCLISSTHMICRNPGCSQKYNPKHQPWCFHTCLAEGNCSFRRLRRRTLLEVYWSQVHVVPCIHV